MRSPTPWPPPSIDSCLATERNRLIADAENTILESNSVLRFLQPDLSLAVLDPTIPDFKPSALRSLARLRRLK